MTRFLAFLLLLQAAAPMLAPRGSVTAPARAALPVDDKAVKALEAWLKVYFGGKIDFASHKDVGKESIAEKFGVMPKGVVGTITPQRDLEIILEQVVKVDSAAAAEAALAIAAIGLDKGRFDYKPEMAPFAVRLVGEKWLVKITGATALDYLAKAGRGEIKFDKTYGAGMRAAALRFHGLKKEVADRSLLERNLAAAELPVRLACAEALQLLADEAAAPALSAALDRENSDVVLGAIVQALHACFAKYLVPTSKPAAPPKDAKDPKQPKDGDQPADGKPPEAGKDPGATPPAAGDPKPDAKDADAKAAPAAPVPPPELPEASRVAARAVVRALGRTSWRADMALVQFLFDFRTKDAIPALIDVLQRFKDHPEEVQSGKLSALLLHRAHETLVSMTGSLLPVDAPEKWRELWERDKDKLEVVPREKAEKAGSNATVAQRFCGIPVQGSRVVFIVDLSRSMTFKMNPPKGADEADKTVPRTRIDFARKQLREAIAGMPETSRFNFITFCGKPEAFSLWKEKELPRADKKNKEKAVEFVNQMFCDWPRDSPNGGTNMWAGLEEALKMKSMVYGDRYASNVDEIFLVSDGAPSVGEIVDPIEILRVVTETNRFSKIRINTIFITSWNDEDPRKLSLAPDELMRRMAEQNGGKCVVFKD